MDMRKFACLAAGALLGLPPLVDAEEVDTLQEIIECGSVADTGASTTDYRHRTLPRLAWNIADIKRNHYDPAVARIRRSEYTRTVMADLHFLLIRWPNHYPALQALVEYELGGGRAYEFLPAKCYFIRARQFAPDDENVRLYESFYRWKKGDTAQAMQLLEEALEIAPRSVEAHYNIGLLLVEKGDFSKAREHAKAAYAGGYPLPGLRRQLERAGHSIDSPVTVTTPR